MPPADTTGNGNRSPHSPEEYATYCLQPVPYLWGFYCFSNYLGGFYHFGNFLWGLYSLGPHLSLRRLTERQAPSGEMC